MTKILLRRVVSSSKLSDAVRKEYYDADVVMGIPNRLIVETKFATIPDVLTGAVLEDDDDLEEQWVHSKIADPRYHWCHLHMTDDEWKKLGLRKSLYGSSALVKGQVITYGRWSGKNPNEKRYTEQVKSLTHVGIGSFHEGDHGFRHLFGLPSTTTHYYFYGYDRIYSKEEEKELKPKRWKRPPDPITGWQSLPWERLPVIGQVPPAVPQSLLPLVERQMNQLIRIAELNGTPIRITSTYRTFAEQDELYAQGRTKPGNIVTNARGGESLHNYKIAFDIVFRNEGYNGDFGRLAQYANVLGLEWGDRGFVDQPHFQNRLGYELSDFMAGRVDYSKYT